MLGAVTQNAVGSTTAPGAGAVVVDSGDIKAGVYKIEAFLSFSDTLAAGKELTLEHRDAADGSTIRVLGAVPAGAGAPVVIERYEFAEGEELRVVNGAVVGAAGSIARGNIRLYRYG